MPNRILKESICTSEEIASLSANAEVLFYRLLVKSDDYGVFHGNSAIIRSMCYPLKSDAIKCNQVEKWLNELVCNKLIHYFTGTDGKRYIKIETWEKHQQIRAKRSKFPAPAINCNQLHDDCKQLQADDCYVCRNPIQSNPNPIQSDHLTMDSFFEEMWKMYPRKEGKRNVSKKAKQELYEAGHDVVLSAIECYSELTRGRDAQYIKQGSTFFNGAWKDYVSAPETKEPECVVNGDIDERPSF
jgi:hypothetical protein